MSGNNKNMDKKTKTIVIVVMAVVVLGGLFYGYNRWRQQQLANQILKEMYGVNTGLLGKVAGGGAISNQIAQEMAKQAAQDAAQQKADEAKEAAKTPQDKFNETKSVSLTGNTASLVKEKVEPELIAVFGEIKPTLFSGGYMGSADSFLVTFKIPRVPTSEDFNKLTEEFTKNGYTASMNSVTADSAGSIFDNNEATISISYENSSDQEIGILYAGKAKE